MNDTAMSVLGRMAGSSELNLTEIEISSMYRSGPSLDEYPHNAGRGIDIKSIKSATDPVVFDDSNFQNTHELREQIHHIWYISYHPAGKRRGRWGRSSQVSSS